MFSRDLNGALELGVAIFEGDVEEEVEEGLPPEPEVKPRELLPTTVHELSESEINQALESRGKPPRKKDKKVVPEKPEEPEPTIEED